MQVLFNICDAYIRRNEGQERVIGTLLGSVGHDGSVVIKNSYAVPHNESQGQVAVDIDFHRTMYDLHHRVNPKEVIVGWFSTGRGVDASDALLQVQYNSPPPHRTAPCTRLHQLSFGSGELQVSRGPEVTSRFPSATYSSNNPAPAGLCYRGKVGVVCINGSVTER